MSVTEDTKPPRLFGRIGVESLASNKDLARHVMAIVKKACERKKRGPTFQDITDGMLSGQYALWGVMGARAALEAVAVTQRDGATLKIVMVGPEIGDFAEFLPQMENEARKIGCERLTLAGPSFFRDHVPKGWFTREVLLERDLSDVATRQD